MDFKFDDSAKGAEKRIFKVLDIIIAFNNKVDSIFYGNPSSKNKTLKLGVYRILQELNGIPLCNIVNYLLSRVKIKPNPIFERVNIIATKLSNTINAINKFPTLPYTSERYSATGKLQITQVQLNDEQRAALKELRDEINDGFTPDILSTLAQFPQGAKARTTINNILAYINNASTLQNLPTTKYQNLQKSLDDLMAILNGIKLATAPSIALIPGIGKHIDALNKIVDPNKLVPFITQLIRMLRGISRSIRVIVKVAQTIRLIAKSIAIIAKALKVIISILKKLPIPAQVVTVGIITTASDKLSVASKKVDDLNKRATQIKIATSIIITIMSGLSSKVDLTIIELNKLLITIRGCSLFDQTNVEAEVLDLINDLQKTNDQVKKFIPTEIDSSGGRVIRSGRYSIKIIEEEVVDRGIKLRRRRAVAFDERGILILEGTPTFATDISILIEELRLKLNFEDGGDIESIDNVDLTEYLTEEDINEIESATSEEFQSELNEDEAESQKDTINFIKSIPNGKSRLNRIKSMFKKRKKFIDDSSIVI